VRRAAAAGVQVLAVTDHDTMGGCDESSAACADAGLEFVPGIEITAVCDAADVHVLGYFIDTRSAALQAFLATQRKNRIDRVRQMIDRLAAHGIALDADAILAPGVADTAKAAGRPWIARAMVAAGHAASTDDAFARWLSRGRPAFVPRSGAAPEEVFARIHDAGGIASLAHPGLVGRDEWLDGFARAGLDALEVYHTDHDEAAVARYAAAARQLGLAVSGGSDFHGDATHGATSPGTVSLPREDYETLKARARRTLA
jgi:hypothetical protein